MNKKPVIGLAIDGVLTVSKPEQAVWMRIMGDDFIKNLYRNAQPNWSMINFINLIKERGCKIFLVSRRIGEDAREYTVKWLEKLGLSYLKSGLHVNYVGNDLLDAKLEAEHKITMIKQIGIELYFESNRKMAEELRKETDAVIICTSARDLYERIGDD